MRDYVRPKKYLGQHFLADHRIAEKIVQSLDLPEGVPVFEIGPGKGVLTRFLIHRPEFLAVEVDVESVEYLHAHYPEEKEKILLSDFRTLNPELIFEGRPFAIIGNFPYHLSGTLLEYFLKHRKWILSVVGMFQKEVSERLCASEGNKTYGIFSVLIQTFYRAEYLFTVREGSFVPPPKVRSGVVRLTRYRDEVEGLKEEMWEELVRRAFGQRRKILGNSLKMAFPRIRDFSNYAQKRPEQLSVHDFLNLAGLLSDEK